MRKQLRHAVLLIALAPLGACDALGIGDEEGLALSFAVPRTSASLQAASFRVDPITVGSHTLDVQSAEIEFDYVVLERIQSRTESDEGTASDRNNDVNDEEVLDGPITVALPLNGGVVTPATESLPLGVYGEAEVEIANVRVKGTYDGQPFDVVIRVEEGFEVMIDPAVEIKAATDQLNLTLNVDVNSWFRTSTGLVDPRTAAANETARLAARGRIARSFLAFPDSDRDGDRN